MGGEDGHDVVGDAEVKLEHAILGGRLVEVLARGVHDLHNGGDGGVELAAVVVRGAAGAQAVQRAEQLAGLALEGPGIELAGVRASRELPDDGPGALDEAVGTGDGLLVPVEVLLGRGDEQDDEAHRVGTVGLDDTRGRHDVALGL